MLTENVMVQRRKEAIWSFLWQEVFWPTIFQGLEVRISYLWNREEEIRRIEENSGKNAEC